jgi:hypothetical protein
MAKGPRRARLELDTLDDDTLIYVFAFLSVFDILSVRQVSTPVQRVAQFWLQ